MKNSLVEVNKDALIRWSVWLSLFCISKVLRSFTRGTTSWFETRQWNKLSQIIACWQKHVDLMIYGLYVHCNVTFRNTFCLFVWSDRGANIYLKKQQFITEYCIVTDCYRLLGYVTFHVWPSDIFWNQRILIHSSVLGLCIWHNSWSYTNCQKSDLLFFIVKFPSATSSLSFSSWVER